MMGFNKSPFAFEDVKTLFDQALSAANGLRIRCSSRGAAINLRSRFNYFRKMDRAANLKIYDEDHPMYGHSPYDTLVLKVPAKGHPEANILFIEPHRPDPTMTIEEIP